MSSSHNESIVDVRCQHSLKRSQARRLAAWRARRRRLRRRGGALSLASVALAVAVLGAAGAGAAPLLSEGANGSAVSAVQKALGISASGVFDHRTEAAVTRFQQRHGLAVDGIVGPQTRGALGLGAPAPAQATQSSAGGAPLQSIAQCESGGDPHAVGGGGQYRGKYQFTRATWQSVGGTGDPAAAPEAEQDQRAAMLYQRSGASQWPVCGR